MKADTFSFAAMILCAAGAIVALAGLRSKNSHGRLWQLLFVGCSVLLKTAAIGLTCAASGSHYFNSPSEMFGLLAWALACSYLLALSISAVRSLGAVILPVVVLLMSTAQLQSAQQQTLGVPPGSLFAAHIIAAFLGYGLFLTACGASIFYLQQGRFLKQKSFSMLFSDLPSLERLERLEILCAWLGLAAFTVAIGAGEMLARQMNKPFWFEPKVISAQLTWLIFGALLVGRTARRLNGRAAAKFVLAGAALVFFTFALGHPFGRPPENPAKQSPRFEFRMFGECNPNRTPRLSREERSV